MKINVNGQEVEVFVPEDTPLLWVLREELNLNGTKFGCGKGLCGACTVHLEGKAVRSCSLPVVSAQNKKVHTIESVFQNKLHPLQKHWIQNSVPQCGYCQSSQIMQALSLLNESKTLTKSDLIAGMNGNICRCGSYDALKKSLIETAKEIGRLKDEH